MARTKNRAPGARKGPIVCQPKLLPREHWLKAAELATQVNPLNRPATDRMGLVAAMAEFRPDQLAVLTTKYWSPSGVRLTVGFLDDPSPDLKKRLLLHMNAWSKTANVRFVSARTDPQVRITRTPGLYHWSYLGTDILSIPADQPTMNLDSFTMQTPDSEFYRVVRHETGHTLGFPHEHMRRELVEQIDPEKAIEFYGRTQGWTPEMTRRQVLTPIEEGSILATPYPDPNSIMCYQVPGSLTRDGEPILGGTDIDDLDYEFIARIYPKSSAALTSAASRSPRGRSAVAASGRASR